MDIIKPDHGKILFYFISHSFDYYQETGNSYIQKNLSCYHFSTRTDQDSFEIFVFEREEEKRSRIFSGIKVFRLIKYR